MAASLLLPEAAVQSIGVESHPRGTAAQTMTHDEHGSSTTARRVGRIILLNGGSSAGKSTLARAIQAALDEPFLHCSSDMLAVGLPERRDSEGPFAWGNVRPRFFAGFHGCVVALASAGNDLIVDHVIEFPDWRVELRELLLPFDVFLVGVHCSLGELERRERDRGDRRIGEGREHVEIDRIHELGPYDLEVDTTDRDPGVVAAEVIRHWRCRSTSVLRKEMIPAGREP
jgi:chloramphenicol 3-O phosphotransferase